MSDTIRSYSDVRKPMDRYTSGAMVAIGRIIAVALVLLAGCSRGHEWTGEWSGKLPESYASGDDQVIVNTLRSVHLTIEPDATFELTVSGIPYTGEARLGRNSATLQVKEILGRDVERAGSESAFREFVLNLKEPGKATLRAVQGDLPTIELTHRQPETDR